MKLIQGEIAQQKQKLQAYEGKAQQLKTAQDAANLEHQNALEVYRDAHRVFEAARQKQLDANEAAEENGLLVEFHLRNIDELESEIKARQNNQINAQATEPDAESE